MCSGRVDLEFIFQAFLNGEDGVFIGGCKLGECNYTTQGNYDALSNVLIAKKIMERLGMYPDRLRIQFVSSSDGALLAEATDEFTARIRELGPLGPGEGLEADDLRLKLEAVLKLVPYIKLVERERLRVPRRTPAEYREFFASDEVNRLFDVLIGDKLAVSRIMTLLQEEPLSTAAIAARLRLEPGEVARQINAASRQGLVRYDEDRQCYALA